MYQFEFTGRAPSLAQIKAHVKKALAQGHGEIELSWGENLIELKKNPYPYNGMGAWHGYGWIRRIGGHDLAREIK